MIAELRELQQVAQEEHDSTKEKLGLQKEVAAAETGFDSRHFQSGINKRLGSAAPRGGGSGGGLSRTLWSQGSHWTRSGARRLNLVTGLTSSRGNAGGMLGPSTAHPSASSPLLSSLMLTVPRSQLLPAAQRQRFVPLVSHW